MIAQTTQVNSQQRTYRSRDRFLREQTLHVRQPASSAKQAFIAPTANGFDQQNLRILRSGQHQLLVPHDHSRAMQRPKRFAFVLRHQRKAKRLDLSPMTSTAFI